jgi:hypothetical protein
MRSSMHPQTCFTVHVPLSFVKRGGRKMIVIESPTSRASLTNVNQAVVKALAKAHRWRRLIEEGSYGSITELANAQNVNQSYACRILRLTLLAPEIVEAVLDGRLAKDVGLKEFVKSLPSSWREQQRILSGTGCRPSGASLHSASAPKSK